MKPIKLLSDCLLIIIIIFGIAFLLQFAHFKLFAPDFLSPQAIIVVFAAFFFQLFQIRWN